MPIKVISLNIEGHRHLERIIPFLQQEQPQIINLQEVYAVDVPVLEQALQKQAHFTPMAIVTEPTPHQSHTLGEWGLAQFGSEEITVRQAKYYVGEKNQPLPIFFENANPNSMLRAVSWLRGEFAGQLYTVATTHFTWSPRGEATELQRKNLQSLFKVLDQVPANVLTGDFNAPRGGEIFGSLAQRYQDEIPPEVTTSIDGQYHKAGALELMVDGFFSAAEYQVSDVRLVGGLSDHLAVVGTIHKQ